MGEVENVGYCAYDWHATDTVAVLDGWPPRLPAKKGYRDTYATNTVWRELRLRVLQQPLSPHKRLLEYFFWDVLIPAIIRTLSRRLNLTPLCHITSRTMNKARL